MITLSEPIKAEQIRQLICREFDLTSPQANSYGRVSKLVTEQGVYALKKVKVSPNQLVFVDDQLRQLHEAGFQAVLPFLKNKFGDPFVTLAGESYYVTPWVIGQIENQYSPNWEQHVLEQLGRLHALTVKEWSNGEQMPGLPAQLILSRWHKRLQYMHHLGTSVRQKLYVQRAHAIVTEHIDEWLQLGQRAAAYLEQWLDHTKRQTERRVLCHGHVSRTHIISTQHQKLWLNFDYAIMDHPVRDLALFYRRHVAEVINWDMSTGTEWLHAYEHHFPLRKDEKILLAIYLLFPEKVFQVIQTLEQAQDMPTLSRYTQQLREQVHMIRRLRQFVRRLIR